MMTIAPRLFLLSAAFACSVASPLQAELRLAPLFTDHMVLQRDQPVPVWGWSDPGTKVSVVFGDQTQHTTATDEGAWRVDLEPVAASFTPARFTVRASGEDALILNDVLVGDVWICSGQSNMQFGVSGAPAVKALIPDSKNIRSFEVKRTVAFTEQADCEGEWVDRYPNSAVAFGFAHALRSAAKVPVGIVLSSWGSSSIEAWMPRDLTKTVPHFKTMMEEFDANTEAQNKIQAALDGPKPWSRADDVFLRRQSNIVYNAMMHPLAPYACRGIVWYQGERNTQSMFGMVKDPWFSRNSGMLIYGDVLTKWIQRYRAEWGRDDFHCLIVMLPGYFGKKPPATGPQTGPEAPDAHSWAWMRESQLQAMDLPHTSVVNTIDLGDLNNIHPKDKLPIGQRLALLAARDTAGLKIVAEGPQFKRVESKANTLIVHFDHAEGLKTTDGKTPTGFWLADHSAKWVPAQATIRGQSVVLASPKLDRPLHVRYAFAGKPTVNLVNAADLPAFPFRTDRFAP